jgi:hypothetical protein
LNSRFLQGYNIRFTYDCSRPVGSRVGTIEIGNEQTSIFVPLDETKTVSNVSQAVRYSFVAPLSLIRGGNRYKDIRDYADNVQPSTASVLDAIETDVTSNSGVLTGVSGTAITVAPTCDLSSCNASSFFVNTGDASTLYQSVAKLAVVLLCISLLQIISTV